MINFCSERCQNVGQGRLTLIGPTLRYLLINFGNFGQKPLRSSHQSGKERIEQVFRKTRPAEKSESPEV